MRRSFLPSPIGRFKDLARQRIGARGSGSRAGTVKTGEGSFCSFRVAGTHLLLKVLGIPRNTESMFEGRNFPPEISGRRSTVLHP